MEKYAIQEYTYTYRLNINNTRCDFCWVDLVFTTNDDLEFIGFTSIVSDYPLDSDDLAHLEEWVVQAKGSWKIQILD
jgi:hypothetical protein